TAGGIWREGNVRTVLDSGFGAGYFVHRGELVKGVHPPVITEMEWQRYQDARDGRLKIAPRARSSRYLLTGLAKCGYCGYSMQARPDRIGHVWYRCKHRTLAGCPNPLARMDEVERQVMIWLRGLVG